MARESRSPRKGIYVEYPVAFDILNSRLSPSPTAEEMAAWVFCGPKDGGLQAYTNANELSPPPKFHFSTSMGGDYLGPLMATWFSAKDLEKFEPRERFIACPALRERWNPVFGAQTDSFIEAKIRESRLLDLHPTQGSTMWTNWGDEQRPSKETALFRLRDVVAIEESNMPGTPISDDEWLDINEETYNGRPIDWDYWVGTLAALTPFESGRLMSALDPALFCEGNDVAPTKHNPLRKLENAKRIQRAAEREGASTASAEWWLRWADDKPTLKVYMGFRRAVEARTQAHTKSADQMQPSRELSNSAPEKKPKRTWADPMSAEIENAFRDLGEEASPSAVMGQLKTYSGKAGSCITESGAGFVLWLDAVGEPRKLDMGLLRKRLHTRRERQRAKKK